MKHCSYCGKELKDTQAWCPHCMHRQLAAATFENVPVERDAKHTRALRVIPCCLTAAAAVILAAVLVPAAFRPSPPVEAVVLPSESGAPVVLTEPEITSDPVIATEPTEAPSAVESHPVEQNYDDYVLREVDMNFFAQKLTEYLHQQYPNHLLPSEKLPGMKEYYFLLPSDLIHEQDWNYYLAASAWRILYSTSGLSYCVDWVKAQSSPVYNTGDVEMGKEISDYYPEYNGPLLTTTLFSIEYVGRVKYEDVTRADDHRFVVRYFLERPICNIDNFNSEQFLEAVRERLPSPYVWIDSFIKDELPYKELVWENYEHVWSLSIHYNDSSIEECVEYLYEQFCMSVASQSLPASYYYYDLYVSDYVADQPGTPYVVIAMRFFQGNS